ncbi:hypothetical protein Tco_1309175 [Tanacetum coccineum]
MYGMILYLVQCKLLCRIPVFPLLTGCDTISITIPGQLRDSPLNSGLRISDGVTKRSDGVTKRSDGVTKRSNGVTKHSDGVTIADNPTKRNP